MLRRHVGDGADGRAGASHEFRACATGWIGEVGFARGSAGYGRVDLFRQAEIEDFGIAARSDKDICGLDVAMHDIFRVRRLERIGNLNSQLEDIFERHRPPGDSFLQRLAIEILHDDKGAAVFLADVVNGADIRMVERGSRLRFAPETLQRLAILGHLFRQEFQGHRAVQPRVFGFIDNAHAAAAEFFDYSVMRDGLADHRFCARILDCGCGQVNAARFLWQQSRNVRFVQSRNVRFSRIRWTQRNAETTNRVEGAQVGHIFARVTLAGAASGAPTGEILPSRFDFAWCASLYCFKR